MGLPYKYRRGMFKGDDADVFTKFDNAVSKGFISKSERYGHWQYLGSASGHDYFVNSDRQSYIEVPMFSGF